VNKLVRHATGTDVDGNEDAISIDGIEGFSLVLTTTSTSDELDRNLKINIQCMRKHSNALSFLE
jgi:hypothetical protein